MILKSGIRLIFAIVTLLSFSAVAISAERSGQQLTSSVARAESTASGQKTVTKRNRRETVPKPKGSQVQPVANSQKAGSAKNATTGSGLPAAVKSEEVKFTGSNLQLAGTFLLPKSEAGKRAPAVIIFGDAKPATRDAVAAGNGSHFLYRDLAQHFAGLGIAVLRYDRRCVGTSDCKPQSSFDDFIIDGEMAVKYLRSRPEIDPKRIFLLGHGEGGLLASVVASHDEGSKDKLAGLLLAAAPGRFGHRVVRDQLRLFLTDQGSSESEIADYLKKSEAVFNRITVGESNFADVKFDAQSAADVELNRLTKDPSFAFGLLSNDPLQIIKSVKIPVLIMQGDKDQLITVSDAEYLEEALTREGHADYTMKIIPDADHVFKVNKGEASLKNYRDASRPTDPAAIKLATEWILKRLK